MDFDRLLTHHEGTGQKEVVALAVFYLEEYKEQNEVTREEIHAVVEPSRTSVPLSNISTYLGRLQNDGLLTTIENNGYRLKHEGIEYIESRLDDVLINDPREESFINSSVIDDDFYEQLISDINECYRIRVNSASLV